MNLAEVELRSAEFVAVDTETNGRAGEDCELTEVGAVLVGGGELHERIGSLVAVRNPLSRGIQRFTGITQAMVAEAPPPETVLPQLARMLEGRVLVAHSASFDRRVLRQAFARADLEWPEPPVLCTVALARRFAPLAGQRKLVPLAASLGIEVHEAHRALSDAETCARVFCALFPRLCAHAPTLGDALALLSPRRRRAKAPPKVERRPPADRPDLSALPDDPGVYIFRDADGRVLYVGKSVSLRTRARSHFTAAAGFTGETEIVDHRPTHSELGALVLENRLIKTLRPPANVALTKVDRHMFLVCKLDADYPILEVSAAPAPGHAVSIGPVRGRAAAKELVEQLQSLFGLRHCTGRRLKLREHPSAYGQMGRCLSPCLGDLDPNLYRSRIDAALALFSGPGDGGGLLLEHIQGQMAAAAAEQRYERAAWLRRRHRRLEILIDRLGGVLRATHADPRLVLACHPKQPRHDAFWIVGGRVADWGELPGQMEEIEARTAAALARAPRPGETAHVPPEEIDEVRIVANWLASHNAPALALDPAPDRKRLAAFVRRAQEAGLITQNSR